MRRFFPCYFLVNCFPHFPDHSFPLLTTYFHRCRFTAPPFLWSSPTRQLLFPLDPYSEWLYKWAGFPPTSRVTGILGTINYGENSAHYKLDPESPLRNEELQKFWSDCPSNSSFFPVLLYSDFTCSQQLKSLGKTKEIGIVNSDGFSNCC